MIRLTEIQRKNNYIYCNAFLEDSTNAIQLRFSVASRNFDQYEFPDGYDWCKEHMNIAKHYLNSVCENDLIPENHTIMWC